ncbi:MAG: TonB-dependent receptor plug domain-containing protein, partial [Gammaproteobacteria bacterium]|nr:TonB-dependent receptor plug domain-containing protein [Gammaproteobacteria bacterium]
MHKQSLIPGFAFALASFSQPSAAQGPGESGATARDESGLVEEVIVTARFRDESVDDVGQTINLYTGEELRRRGVVDFDDIVRMTPGLDSLSRGPGRNLPYIRGISSQNSNGDFFHQPSANTIFFDEVPITLLTSNQSEVPLMDLGRIEVIKGSQPTYFGEGSVGGSIRFFSQNPSLSEVETRLRTELSSTRGGDLNFSVDASLGIPIVQDKLGLRISAIQDDRSGFIDNLTEDVDDVNGYERFGFTAVLLFEPNDNLTWRLSGFYQDQDIGSEQAASLDLDDLELTVPGPDERKDESVLVANKIRWDIQQVTVESVTGYFRRTFDRHYYDTFNTDNLNNLFMLPGTVVSNTYQRDETFSQELRVITNFDAPINFVGGIYYTDSDANTRGFATTDSFLHTVIFGT